jgi:hypothetical protein
MAFNSYVLSDAESQRIFNKEIVPRELDPVMHVHHHQTDGKQPLAVLIVGQTGAGKTRLAPVLREAMVAQGRTPAHFIADTYKAYHPAYEQLVAETPAKASPATGTDARRWLTMACQLAISLRVDTLVESACRHPDDFISLAKAFSAGGYRVLVAILAVPEGLSRLGILVRFHQDLPEARSGKLPLRLTPKKVHDDSYKGLADAAAFIDASPAANAVMVVRRGNLVAYSNHRTNSADSWVLPSGALAALEAERTRLLTKDELDLVSADLDMLQALNDPAVDAQIHEIRALISPIAESPADNQAATHLPVLSPLDAPAFMS